MTALAGIKVVDFSVFLPGPLASHLLSEAGADVVRIEPHPGGDPLREYEPRLGAVGAMYALLNHGKTVLTTAFQTPTEDPQVRQLIEDADIVLVQSRPSDAVRQGLDWDGVRAINPTAVHCLITGYGGAGSLAERPGYDLTFLADSGLLDAWRNADGDPVLPPTAIADIAGGTYPAVLNMLLALRRRDATGMGGPIVVSMAHNLQVLSYRHLTVRRVSGSWPDPHADPLGGALASYNIYRTEDMRHIAVYALAEPSWKRLAAVVGLDPGDAADPGSDRAHVALSTSFAQRPAADWHRLFAETGVKATVVSTFAEAEEARLAAQGGAGFIDSAGQRCESLPSVIAPHLRREPTTELSPTLDQTEDRV